MPKALMSRLMHDRWLKPYLYKMENAGWRIVVSQSAPPLRPDDWIRDLVGVDAIFANGPDVVDARVIAAAKSLKVIARTGVGFDKVDIRAAAERGIPVTVTPGSNSETVADFTMGLILCLARGVPRLNATLKSGSWAPFQGFDVFGKTIGIVGLGRIGRGVTRRAAAFGMRLLGHDPIIDPGTVAGLGVRLVELDRLLSESDFVTLHVPASADTEGMIGARELGLMKPGAYIVNTARGELIDEAALFSALEANRIAGAGLDVFAGEPINTSPLFGLESVVVSPHVAGNTVESVARMAEAAVDNVLAVVSGDWPRDIVVNGVYASG